jgi:hypothetical protein
VITGAGWQRDGTSKAVGLENADLEMHAQSSSSVVVCHLAGRAWYTAVPVNVDGQTFLHIHVTAGFHSHFSKGKKTV